MRLKETHGRKNRSDEYYTWTVERPEVFVQRVGKRWLLGINHTDGTSQSLAYVDELEPARQAGKRLTQLYATAEHYTVEDDVKLARDLWLQLDAKRGVGLTTIVAGQ